MSVKELQSKLEFEELIKSDRLVVIDAYAEWCGPCKTLAPKLDEYSTTYPKVVFAKFDINKLSDLSKELRIRAMPTLHFYQNGEIIGSVLGFDPNRIEQFIKEKMTLS